MKTLKKTLCLVLAVVMAVGVLMIPASAANYDDFTDKGKIEHTTAVAVLNGMGIIDGKENNNFDPTGTLTRAEAAKIVVYAELGKTSAEKLSASASKFSDVAGHWAAKYISYAAQLNVLQGNGDGTVEPEGKLTGYALAKMLLVAAGVEGTYIGADWENNVMLAANKNGFMDGLNIDLSKDISRDDAAQMVWNALWYAPEGKTTEYIVYYEKGTNDTFDATDSLIWRGPDEVTALLMKMGNEDITDKDGNVTAAVRMTTGTTSEGSIGNEVYGLKEGSKKDAFGRVSTTYYDERDTTGKTVYAEIKSEPETYYTNAVSYDKILSDLGYKSVDSATLTVYNNSAKGETKTYQRNSTEAKVNIGARGTLVEVYAGAKADTYDVIVVDTYVGEVTKVNSAKAETADSKAVPANIIIDKDETLTFATDKFAKGDIVLYTKADGAVANVVKADSISGSVTATASGYIRVNGDVVYVSEHNTDGGKNTKPTIKTTPGYNYSPDEYTYYLDSYGNAIKAVKGKVAEVDTDYIFVCEVRSNDNRSDTDLFETTSTPAVAQAKVLHLDTGEFEVVNIAVVQGTDGDYYYANQNGAASSKKVEGTKKDAFSENTFYEYAMVGDEYVLVGNTPVASSIKTITLQKGKADTDVKVIVKDSEGKDKDQTLFVNSNTELVTVSHNTNWTSATVTSANGFGNFPSSATKYENALVVYNSSYMITKVISVAKAQPVATKANYAIYDGVGETTDVTYYAFYVDGEQVQYANKGDLKDSKGNAMVKGDVYDLSVVESESKITATPVEKIEKGVVINALEDDYFISGSKVYYFAAEVEIYDANDSYAVGELDTDISVTLATDKDGKVDFIIIEKDAE